MGGRGGGGWEKINKFRGRNKLLGWWTNDLDCSNGFTGTYICPNLKLNTFNVHVKCTSIKLIFLKNKTIGIFYVVGYGLILFFIFTFLHFEHDAIKLYYLRSKIHFKTYTN